MTKEELIAQLKEINSTMELNIDPDENRKEYT